jgi:hypothetical protein
VLEEIRSAAGKIRGKKAEVEIAKLLNTVRDPIGLGVLHLAAGSGNCRESLRHSASGELT